MNDSTTKRCPHCSLELPLTPEYFGSNKSEPSGFNTYCKSCWRTIQQSRRDKRRAELGIVPIPDGFRKCGVCEQILPATREYFTGNPKGKDGLQSYCKGCGKVAQQKYRDENPDRVRVTDRKRNKNPNRKEQQKLMRRLSYYRDPLRKQKQRVKNQRRRALLNNAPGQYTQMDLDAQYDNQKGRCWWCESELNGVYDADHLIPLSRGGSNWPNNIVLACEFCNSSRNNKMPWEWSDRLI